MAYGFIIFLLQFILPLVSSLFVYIKVVKTLQIRSRLRLKNTKSQAKREKEISRNKKRTFLLLSMIAGIAKLNQSQAAGWFS